ncbi:hypothetical protein ACKWTF_009153 [Chironomus riparius]
MKSLYKFDDIFEVDKVFNCFGISLIQNIRNKHGKVFLFVSIVELSLMLISLSIDFVQNLTSKQLIYSIVQFCMMEVAAHALITAYILFYKHLPELSDIVLTLKEDFPQDLKTQKKHNIHRKLRVINWFVNICMIIYFSCIDFFDISPLFWRIYDSFMLQEVRLKLPFEMYCPFNVENMFVYILMYLLLVWASYTIVIVMLCYDFSFVSVLTCLCIQVEILCDKIQNINPQDKNSKEDLKSCIEMHKKLIVIVEKTDEVFSFVMLHNILASTGVICVSSFLVVHGVEISLIWTFMEMLLTGLIQISLHCYYGEKLLG